MPQPQLRTVPPHRIKIIHFRRFQVASTSGRKANSQRRNETVETNYSAFNCNAGLSFNAASASDWPGNRHAYLVIPTIVKTLLKCGDNPNAEIVCAESAPSSRASLPSCQRCVNRGQKKTMLR